jgi:hypothetical protein
LSHSASLFCVGFFRYRVLWNICLLWTTIFMLSASWVARMTGVNHWHIPQVESRSNPSWLTQFTIWNLPCHPQLN